MFSTFVRNLVPDRSNPIGIDFGTTSVRAIQIQRTERELTHTGVAFVEAPPSDEPSPVKLFEFYQSAMRAVAASFKTKRCVLVLPNWMTHLRHVRVPRGGEIGPAIAAELEGKLPVDASACMIRHVVAGEVYGDQNAQQEVVVMATRHDLIRKLLATAEAARLDVVGLSAPATVMVDCFKTIYRRKSDQEDASLFIDLGASSTRVFVGKGGLIRFARSVNVTADSIRTAVASAANLNAVQLDRACHRLLEAEAGNHPVEPPLESLRECIETHAQKLAGELEMCRRYYESTFPSSPLAKVIFLGGGANDRVLCQTLARSLALPAQVGDVFVRIAKNESAGESCVDRGVPQPCWAAAVGASLSQAG